MIILCCEVGCSSVLAQAFFWVFSTPPHLGTWHYLCLREDDLEGKITYLYLYCSYGICSSVCRVFGEGRIILLCWLCCASHWIWYEAIKVPTFQRWGCLLLSSSCKRQQEARMPICGGAQTGSEHSVCLPGLSEWLEDCSSNKWIDFLPSLLIWKQVMMAKREALKPKQPSPCVSTANTHKKTL